MTKKVSESLLRRVRLELARDHDFPNGSREHGYDFIAPIDEKGQINAAAWKELRDKCRVRRFWGGEDAVGHILHRPGGGWSFHYDIRGDAVHDERGYHFENHTFKPGEYVSIREQDGVLRTFRVISVRETD
jgi:hypothetical protein